MCTVKLPRFSCIIEIVFAFHEEFFPFFFLIFFNYKA
jgi:hypothetical protein